MAQASSLWKLEPCMACYAVNLIDLPIRDEKWVARLWNVSEERVINAVFNFTTTPFNAPSLRFQGMSVRSLQTIGSKTKAG